MNRPISLARCRRLTVLVLVAIIVNGCAGPRRVTPPSPPATAVSPPGEYRPAVGPAAALFAEAEKALQAGKPDESEMLLERALRVEPRNPHYWHTMAEVKYRQKHYHETVQFCLKSDSLAGKQTQLVTRNKELMRRAKQAMSQK